ncbi:MAG TPA: iron-sulfur cluster assembly accessory protein, partial [Bdellovibrionales bacterium]|nr:iron-sulfur cluster assembly accessory protein [Bdellovibrionales bacterium]
MIHISEKAAQQISKVREEEGQADGGPSFLRIQVVGGGCSGMSYKLAFDNKKNESDKVFAEHGVEVVVDTKSYLYLVGSMLDYSGGLNGKGFFMTTPNATKNCGCGSS